MYLVGDIGGTKTHLALFESRGSRLPVQEERYVSRDYPSLLHPLKRFLERFPAKLEGMCFGVAGPVIAMRCSATNLPWVIDAEVLSKEFQVQNVFLLNDLEALAHGALILEPQDFVLLSAGKTSGAANQGLIAAGTGLGEAGLYWDGKRHIPFACEGGHVDFAPTNELEIRLLSFLKKEFGHVSYERLLSGSGLPLLFRFLIESGLERKPDWLEGVKNKEELPSTITKMALEQSCAVSVRALDWFVSIYGSEAGNVCLKFLALGGIYLGGGIAPKILPALESKSFMEAFVAKGRMQKLLENVPVKVIRNKYATLLGALHYLEQ